MIDDVRRQSLFTNAFVISASLVLAVPPIDIARKQAVSLTSTNTLINSSPQLDLSSHGDKTGDTTTRLESCFIDALSEPLTAEMAAIWSLLTAPTVTPAVAVIATPSEQTTFSSCSRAHTFHCRCSTVHCKWNLVVYGLRGPYPQ